MLFFPETVSEGFSFQEVRLDGVTGLAYTGNSGPGFYLSL
ncbi:hypothetical protein HDF15_004751 [Granulicella mallensis]|jgi:hypothetical protein|uniref:Uncharacterized protein n=1 Tax=Granulicella mallensis TaxID=940614 RepID=A0A7W7ZVD2_9BACT|nr:hypothetical protein [Granulicella mallensis]